MHDQHWIYLEGIREKDLVVFIDWLYYGNSNIRKESFSSFLELDKEFNINNISGFKLENNCDSSLNIQTIRKSHEPRLVSSIPVHARALVSGSIPFDHFITGVHGGRANVSSATTTTTTSGSDRHWLSDLISSRDREHSNWRVLLENEFMRMQNHHGSETHTDAPFKETKQAPVLVDEDETLLRWTKTKQNLHTRKRRQRKKRRTRKNIMLMGWCYCNETQNQKRKKKGKKSGVIESHKRKRIEFFFVWYIL